MVYTYLLADDCIYTHYYSQGWFGINAAPFESVMSNEKVLYQLLNSINTAYRMNDWLVGKIGSSGRMF